MQVPEGKGVCTYSSAIRQISEIVCPDIELSVRSKSFVAFLLHDLIDRLNHVLCQSKSGSPDNVDAAFALATVCSDPVKEGPNIFFQKLDEVGCLAVASPSDRIELAHRVLRTRSLKNSAMAYLDGIYKYLGSKMLGLANALVHRSKIAARWTDLNSTEIPPSDFSADVVAVFKDRFKAAADFSLGTVSMRGMAALLWRAHGRVCEEAIRMQDERITSATRNDVAVPLSLEPWCKQDKQPDKKACTEFVDVFAIQTATMSMGDLPLTSYRDSKCQVNLSKLFAPSQ